MCGVQEAFAPGRPPFELSEVSARVGAERTAFALRWIRPGMRVLDLGCGTGVTTHGLASAADELRVVGVDHVPGPVGETAGYAVGSSIVDFVAGSEYALPLPEGGFDLAFAHGLFETVARPDAVLAELWRVLRPGGVLALSTPDWSRAKLRPKTANVVAALRGYYLLRRRDGGDPFAGRGIAAAVARAGFGDVREHVRHRADLTYRELSREVENGLIAGLESAGADHPQLASAARSAWVWSRGGDGQFSQCWVDVVATR